MIRRPDVPLVATDWSQWKDMKIMVHRKIKMTMEISMFSRRYIFKWLIFHCHISLQRCNSVDEQAMKSITSCIPGLEDANGEFMTRSELSIMECRVATQLHFV